VIESMVTVITFALLAAPVFGAIAFLVYHSIGYLLALLDKQPTVVVPETLRKANDYYTELLKAPPTPDNALRAYAPKPTIFPEIVEPVIETFDACRSETTLSSVYSVGFSAHDITELLSINDVDTLLVKKRSVRITATNDTSDSSLSPPKRPDLLTFQFPFERLDEPFVTPPIHNYSWLIRAAVRHYYDDNNFELSQWRLTRRNILNDISTWSDSIRAANKSLLERYELAKGNWQTQKDAYDRKTTEVRLRFLEKKREIVNFLNLLFQRYEEHECEGVAQFFFWVLRRSPVVRFIGDPDFTIQYSGTETKILLVDIEYPDISTVFLASNNIYRIGPRPKPAVLKKDQREVVRQLYPAATLQIARELASHDFSGAVDAIAVNASITFIDPATGHSRKTYVVSFFARCEDIRNVNLSRVDPIKCFNAFRGRLSDAETFDVAPITPIIQFDKDSRRFIEPRDVIADLDLGRNLASMDWEDFEHLVRELFAKIYSSRNAEVKITQASRDKGVDAIVYDSTPITGGKTVIQAKRYVNVVDVSSVRDLYGTVLSEGAGKGIIVTTSYYGADSYEFAKDKPLELIDGSNLLALLEKQGYKMKIDLAEARRLNREGDISTGD
jgi:restriction system protein